jgi:glycosyltransferase involved in cell wall biosynthesis
MKVIQLSFSDIVGGGGFRAAHRINNSLCHFGLESTMAVSVKGTDDETVVRLGSSNKLAPFLIKSRNFIGSLPTRFFVQTDKVRDLYSSAILPSHWPVTLNESDADIVNMHWINSEMLSISDISRIRKPLVWTLHDMWAFCGNEHYTNEERWREGYWSSNRSADEKALDLNRWTWNRKRRHWKTSFQIVTPSHWLADCVKKSFLFKDWPVTVIPNAIDTNFWKPVNQTLARQILNLPLNVPIILFGAGGGTSNPRKGFDLLEKSLLCLGKSIDNLELVVFGQSKSTKLPDFGFPVHFVGKLHDELSLKIVYSAADLMAIPSRQDNLPNTGLEAQSCGIPIVCFNTGGLEDIVDHRQSGYLAKPFDIDEFAKGIVWILEEPERLQRLKIHSRNNAVHRWAYPIVGRAYSQLYQSILYDE